MDLSFLQKKLLRQHTALGFLNDEILFLQQFLKTNFPTLFSDGAITRVQLLYNELTHQCNSYNNTLNAATVHQNNLLIKTIDFLKIESERIDDEINNLNKTFKSLKIEIFAFYKTSAQYNTSTEIPELKLA